MVVTLGAYSLEDLWSGHRLGDGTFSMLSTADCCPRLRALKKLIVSAELDHGTKVVSKSNHKSVSAKCIEDLWSIEKLLHRWQCWSRSILHD